MSMAPVGWAVSWDLRPGDKPHWWQAYVMDADRPVIKEGFVAGRGTAVAHAMSALNELGANDETV